MRRRWALRYYDPDGFCFTERRYRTRRRALRVQEWHTTFSPPELRPGWRLVLERNEGPRC